MHLFLPLTFLLPLSTGKASETPASKAEVEGEMVALDTEVSALARTQGFTTDDLSFWGFTRVNYAASGDLPAGTDIDYSAFAVDNARIYLDGNHGPAAVRLSADFASGSATLLDAFARLVVTDGALLHVGQFRTPFLATAQVEANRNLFILPTRNSLFYRVRDESRQGAMLSIEHGPLHWNVAAQNGFDLTLDDLLISSRLELDLVGEGMGDTEGAYGAPVEPRMTAGVAYSNDEAGDDGMATAADVAFSMARFYAQLEVVDYEADYTALDVAAGHILPTELDAGRGDTTPISLTCSHMLPGDDWEAGVRFEIFDDVLDRELLTLGANYYVSGHDAKLQVNFSTESSNGDDADLFGIGLTLSF